MMLSEEQLQTYDSQGYLLLPPPFGPEEMTALGERLPALYGEESHRRVVEKDGAAVRSVYGSHTTDELFGRLTRDRRLLEPAQQVLGGPVYVYQFKINAKVAFEGDVWEWHQDYIFWREEDGLPECRALNVALFLDEVTEFNGPIILIPGSHRGGAIEPHRDEVPPAGYEDDPDWVSNLTADIKYTVDREKVRELAEAGGMVAPKGPAGSILLFHPNMVHSSVPNISPWDRSVCLVSYNSVENLPRLDNRPDFLVSREAEALEPLEEESLLALA